MIDFDSDLRGFVGISSGPVMVPTPSGSWAGTIGNILQAAGGIVGAIQTGAEIYRDVVGAIDSVTGGIGLPTLPQLPATTGTSSLPTLTGATSMSMPTSRGGTRPAQACLADPQVIAILQASQEGRITQADAKARLRALGCMPSGRKKRRKCPRGMTRRKMCAPRPPSICGRPRRPARRKKCGRCVGACRCRKTTGRRRLTRKQLAAGFGGKRRM